MLHDTYHVDIVQKTGLIAIILCFSFHPSWSQTPETKGNLRNALYLEMGTWTIANTLTINYERQLFTVASDVFRLNARIGLGTGLNHGSDYNILHGGLLGGTVIFGKNQNRFMMSGGRIFAKESIGFAGEARSLNPILIEMGWRYENPAKRFTAKVTGGTMGLSIGIGKTF